MYEFLDYRVCDSMTPDPVTIASDATLAEAEAIFEEHDFNSLPVVGPDRQLLGVFTKLDLLAAFRTSEHAMFPPYEKIMTRPVSELMTERVVTVTPREPLTKVLEKMLETRSKSFPVVDGGAVVGMVAREDLLAALRRAVGGERAAGPI